MRGLSLASLTVLFALAACGDDSDNANDGNAEGAATTADTADGGTANTTGDSGLPEAGEVAVSTFDQPEGMHTTCEYGNAWRLHSQHGQNVSVVPQRQYMTSCTDDAGTHLFVSVPVAAEGVELRTQYVYEATVDDATGVATLTGNARLMDMCEDASGIAATPDCSALGVLCQRAYGSSSTDLADADLITPYAEGSDGERGWPLRADNAANEDTHTEMWLYEYPAADLDATPSRMLVHKAVRATDRARPQGQYYLHYGPDDDTYAMALRTSMFTDGGARHTADAFLMIERGTNPSDFVIDPSRGYAWACGRGHTYVNHPGYNPYSRQFGIVCRTDVGGGMYFRTDTMGDPDEPFHNASFNGQGGNVIGGGPTTFVGLPDGGFLVTLVGNPAEEVGLEGWTEGPPTRIGLARFDAQGAMQGEIQWVVGDSEHFLGHAQIAELGEGRYLLGWSRQWQVGDGLDETSMWTIRRRHSFQSAWSWHLMEIDAEGTPLTQMRTLDNAGWGDLDEWVELGDGRVGWSYIEDPALTAWDSAPNCGDQSRRALHVYASPLG